MFLLIMALIGLYVVARYAMPQPWSRAKRWSLAAVVMAFALHYPVVTRFWGSMASPEIPRPLLVVLTVGVMAVLLLAVLLLLRDAIAGVLALLRRTSWRAHVLAPRVAHGLAALSCALAVVGVWQAIKVPEVRQVEIVLPNLAPAFDGYRVVHLTDIHASRLLQGPWVQAVVAKTNALTPDAVMISGDLIDGSPQARAADTPPLAQLRARDGVFAVPGNHEYYSGYVEWMQVFQRLGLRMLINRHVLIQRNGQTLVVAGVPDKVAAGRGLPTPNVQRALAGRPANAPVILLDHRPGTARGNRAAGVDVQLSGHTHGGHVLGFNRVVARANKGFVSGFYPVDGMALYVGNGAGLWPGFAVRLGVPSEITLITLRKGTALSATRH